jgi:acetoin utilization deacetylase AcuC-like enzyme
MIPVVYSRRYEVDLGVHVFATEKWRLAFEFLAPTLQPSQILEPQPATRADLERVHTTAYLDDFLGLVDSMRTGYSELPLTAEIRDAHILATGGTMMAAEQALRHGAAMHIGGGYHHAMPDHAEGFCYLNDIAIALRALQHHGRIERAAVLDTDVHQGNGTARIFQGDDRVLTFSIHQQNNYPRKERSDLDLGLRDGVGDAEYLQHLETIVPDLLDTHRPDLVVMVAGADPYREDLLGGLLLSIEGLRQRDRLIVQACAARAIPLVGLTAGGYARQVADTARIHAYTCLEVLNWNGQAKGNR